VAGPFTVTPEVAGPFQVSCQSYALAGLATVEEDAGRIEHWISGRDRGTYAWVAFAAAGLVTAIAAWLARRRWPYATVLLYTCWLVAILAPLLFSVAMWGNDGDIGNVGGALHSLYLECWPFWIFCGVMIVSQILLLALPIRIVKERPIPRRSIWATAIAAATLFSLVVFGVVVSAGAALWGDGIFEGAGLSFLFVLFSWALWAWVFRSFAHATDPHAYVRRLMIWLLRGSILELLVAVPSHILVRHKDVCCAPLVTAMGIATGLVVILISFGPGIYFLYAQRIRSKSA